MTLIAMAVWQFRGQGDEPPMTQPAQLWAAAEPARAAIVPRLSAAKAERDAAFERYTRLATDSTQPGDRERALAAYRLANSRFRALSMATDGAGSAVSLSPEPAGRDTVGRIEAETDTVPAAIPARVLAGLQSSARVGDAGAQSSLALIYQTAAPGEADPAAAMELLESAAAAGDADAMNALADAYSDGVWVGQDLRKAQSLRRKAAEAGSRLAQWELEL